MQQSHVLADDAEIHHKRRQNNYGEASCAICGSAGKQEPSELNEPSGYLDRKRPDMFFPALQQSHWFVAPFPRRNHHVN
jgi:hypothetical protein